MFAGLTELAHACQSPPLSPPSKTPAVITPVSLQFCTWPASPQAPPHSVPSICSVLFPVLTGPACTGLRAQLRCPSSQVPSLPAARSASPVLCQLPCLPHGTPNITWLHLGPLSSSCSNRAAGNGSRSQELEQRRCGYCSVAGRRADDTMWVSGLGGGVDGALLRSRRNLEPFSQSWEPSGAFV